MHSSAVTHIVAFYKHCRSQEIQICDTAAEQNVLLNSCLQFSAHILLWKAFFDPVLRLNCQRYFREMSNQRNATRGVHISHDLIPFILPHFDFAPSTNIRSKPSHPGWNYVVGGTHFHVKSNILLSDDTNECSSLLLSTLFSLIYSHTPSRFLRPKPLVLTFRSRVVKSLGYLKRPYFRSHNSYCPTRMGFSDSHAFKFDS